MNTKQNRSRKEVLEEKYTSTAGKILNYFTFFKEMNNHIQEKIKDNKELNELTNGVGFNLKESTDKLLKIRNDHLKSQEKKNKVSRNMRHLHYSMLMTNYDNLVSNVDALVSKYYNIISGELAVGVK